MANISEKIFKAAEEMVLVADEKTFKVKGVITPLNRASLQEEFCSLGIRKLPLWLYMGNADGMEPQNVLNTKDKSYRIISSQKIEAFGKFFCTRAILEEVELE